MFTSMNWRSLWVTFLWILQLNYALVLKQWWRFNLIFRRHIQTFVSPGHNHRNNAGQTHHKGTPSIICLHWPFQITYIKSLFNIIPGCAADSFQWRPVLRIWGCHLPNNALLQSRYRGRLRKLLACHFHCMLRNFSLPGFRNLLVWFKQPGKGSAKRTSRRSSWQSGHLPTKVEIYTPRCLKIFPPK